MFGAPKPLSRIIFDKFDTSHDGKIGTSEFRQLCYKSGYYLSDEELKQGLLVVDADGSGEVDYDEFKKWWSQSDRFAMFALDDEALESRKAAMDTFQAYDADMSGTIEQDEFESLYNDIVSQKLTSEAKEKVWEWMSAGTDKISFNRYLQWLAKQESSPIKTLLTDASLMQYRQ
eukprot:169221_1